MPAYTPEEAAALRQIAMLRAQLMASGMSQDEADAQIFSGGAFNVAGGYGLAALANDAASTAAQFNLGRGNIALAAQDQYLRQVSSPYNVVAATQYMRDTGAPGLATDPILGNVEASPAASYQKFIDELLFPPGGTGAGSAAGSAPAPAQAPAQQPRAPLDFGQPMAGVTPQQLAAGRDPRYIGAGTAPTFGRQQPTAAPAGGGLTAQQGAAMNLAGTLPGISAPGFRDVLARGGVPGLNSINARDASLLSPDQEAQWMGLIGSTGRVSDPAATYQRARRLYSFG